MIPVPSINTACCGKKVPPISEHLSESLSPTNLCKMIQQWFSCTEASIYGLIGLFLVIFIDCQLTFLSIEIAK